MLTSDQIRMRRYGPILLSLLLLFGMVCPALCAAESAQHHGCCGGAGESSSPMLCPGSLAQSLVRPSAVFQTVGASPAVVVTMRPRPEIFIAPAGRTDLLFHFSTPSIVLRI
jgi:hypothetical protein